MIHQYKNNGYNIVLDVNSGSVHVVDDIVYDVLPVIEKFLAEGVTEKAVFIERLGQEKKSVMERIGQEKNPASEEQLAEAVEEILELRDAGMLFTEDIYEKYIADFVERETVFKELCLHIAHH